MVGLAGPIMKGVRVFVAHGERSEPDPAATDRAGRMPASGRLRRPQPDTVAHPPPDVSSDPNRLALTPCGMLSREAGKHVRRHWHMATRLRREAMPPNSAVLELSACAPYIRGMAELTSSR